MKTGTGINGMRSAHFGLPDLEGATRFYVEDWGLTVVAQEADRVFLRATGPAYYALALHRAAEPTMLQVDLTIESRSQLDALHASLGSAGVEAIGASGPVDDPGGGHAFTFRDPVEGRVFRVIAGAAEHPDVADVPDRPRKVSHIVLNSPDREARFFVDQLGFKVIDQTKTITFLNCNADHHTLALYHSVGSSFNHLAFEVPDIDSVMSATATMQEHGQQVGWGVGRHGPCDNVFSYFVGPGGFVVEYTAEVEQVDETYRFKGPDEWSFRKGRRDHWGLAFPSAGFRSADTRPPFSAALFTA